MDIKESQGSAVLAESGIFVKKNILFVLLILGVCVTQNGCALIALPFQIAGEAIKLLQKLPAPPPGVF